MVLEIRLSNFFSIKDEMVLDMQAASIQTKKAKELEENTFVCGNERLLKTVAIYGANASGKSSVIKAIRACVGMNILISQLQREYDICLYSIQIREHWQTKYILHSLPFLRVSNMNILLNSIKLRY